MALKIVGAVGIRVRPEAKGFRDEADRQIRRQMGDKDSRVPYRMRPEFNDDELKREFDRHKRQMKRELEGIGKNLDFELPSLRLDTREHMRRLGSLRKAQQFLRDDVLSVRKALVDQVKALNAELARTPKNKRFAAQREDLKRQKWAIEAELAAMRRLYDTRKEFGGDFSRAERNLTEQARRYSEQRKKLYHGEARELGLAALALSGRGKRLASIMESINEHVKSAADYRGWGVTDELKRATERANEFKEVLAGFNAEQRRAITNKVQSEDNERIHRENVEHMRRLRDEAKKTKEYIDGLTGKLDVELTGTKSAAGVLTWLSRPRTVPLHVRVTGKSLAVATGLLKSVAGANTLSKLGSGFENVLRNYDKFSIVAASVATVIGNISNAAIGGVAAIAGIGKGLAQVFQGAAMAPTILGAFATSLVVATTATKDFFAALASGDFSSLTGNALKNAERLKGTWTDLAETIQDNFWERAGTSMSDFVLKAMPALNKGLGETAAAMGKAWDNIFKAFTHSLDVGYMDSMFKGLAETTDLVADAAGPAMRAVMQLGARGAEHLPRLGGWLRDSAEAFERFIAEADAAGRIDQWIDNSVRSIKDLGNVTMGAWRIMEGLADAALRAGGPSLTQFGDAMLRWGEAMKSARGQFIMSELFSGAFEGLSRFGQGLGDFFGAIGRNIGYVRQLESAVGGLGGALFSNLGLVLDNKTFQRGTVQGLEDIVTALGDLRPAFSDAASMVGHLGRLSGAVFKGIAPTINAVVGVVESMTSALIDPVVDLVPRLTSGMGALVGLIAPAAEGGAKAVGGLIDGFNKLPGVVQTALLTLGGLAMLRPHLTSLGDAVGKRLVPAYTRWGRVARQVHKEAAASGRPISMTTAAYRAFKHEMQATGRMALSTGQRLTRTSAAFATFDRLTGMSMYGAYQGMRRASSAAVDFGQASRHLGAALRESGTGFRELGRQTMVLGARAMPELADQVRMLRDGAARDLPVFGAYLRQAGERGREFGQTVTRSVRDGASRAVSAARTQLAPLGSVVRSQMDLAAAQVRSSFAPMVAHVREGSSRVVSAFREAGSALGTTFALPIQQLQSAGTSAKNGLSRIAGGATEAAKAIGTSAGSGLRRAALGLTAALGGGWGMAIAGAAVGIGVLAQASADSKQRVEEFRSTLSPVGNTTFKTYELGAQKASQATKALGMDWLAAGETWYEVGDKIGVSSETLNRAFAGNKQAVEEVNRAVKDWEAQPGFENPRWTHAVQSLKGHVNDAKKELEQAQAETRGWADSLGVTDAKVENMRATWGAMSDQVATARVEGGLLLQTIDTMTNSTVSAADAAYNYYNAWDQGKQALTAFGDKYADSMRKVEKSLFDTNGHFDMTKQSTRELYGIMRSQLEPAFGRVAESFNRFGGGSEGVAAARQTMSDIRGEMMTHLTEVVGMNETAAGQMLDALNIKPDAVEMVLDKANVETNIADIANSLRMLTGQPSELKVKADGSAATMSLQMVRSHADALASKDVGMSVTLEDGRVIEKIGKIDTDVENLAAKEAIVRLAAQDDVSGIASRVKGLLDNGFQNKEYKALLTAMDKASGLAASSRDKIMAAFVNNDYEATLTAIDEASGISEEAKSKLKSLIETDYTANIDANDNASSKTQEVADGIDRINSKDAVVRVTNTGADSINRMIARIESIQDKHVVIRVTNTGADSINRMVNRIEQLQDKHVTINVTNTGAESLNRMQSRLDGLRDKQVVVTVTNTGSESLNRLAGRIDQIENKQATVSVTNTGSESLGRLIGKINEVKSKSAVVTVTNTGAASLSRLKGRIDAIKGKSARVTVTNTGADSLVRLKGRIDAIRSKSERVTVTNTGSDSLVRLKSRIDAIRSKSVRVSASTSGSGALSALQRRINSVRGKTVTVRVNTVGSVPKAFADGGIVNGKGVQTFANGGFWLGRQLDQRIRHLAENHVAQIAPAGAYRVWAEPETGGEAYIPLAKTKRSRSEDILSQVASHFGGRYERPSERREVVTASGDTYNLAINTTTSSSANEISDELMFNLRHLRSGGGGKGRR